MLEYKETSIFCHQLVEYDGKKFLLDASTMKPKFYYLWLPCLYLMCSSDVL